LAAALSHLGADASARDAARRFLALMRSAWKGENSPDDSQCLAWLDRVVPVRSADDRRSLFDGLKAAGLVEPLADDSAGSSK
ncbi:MAG: hypothetical protein DWQ08_13815, partial [Proteobacteria bacterium]